VWKPSNVIAILCADLHLSHKPPVARSDEPDWYGSMARQLNQVADLARLHQAPVVCAGDVFDKWNSPPELINFAINHLPKMFAVPGQHDLPHHNYDEIHKSAYGTLVEAGVIENLEPDRCRIVLPDLVLVGFPWGHPIKPLTDTVCENGDSLVHLAVVHEYCWIGTNKYPNASRKQSSTAHRKKLKGFNAAVFGDNHKGFLTISADGLNLLNCGGFMRRRTDEVEHHPKVGLLHRNGSIAMHQLDCSEDIIITNGKQVKQTDENISEFIGELNSMYDLGLDFEKAVGTYLETHTLTPKTVKLVRKALNL